MSTKVKTIVTGLAMLLAAGVFYVFGMVAQGDEQAARAKAQLTGALATTTSPTQP